jgi:hypothetical protein
LLNRLFDLITFSFIGQSKKRRKRRGIDYHRLWCMSHGRSF